MVIVLKKPVYQEPPRLWSWRKFWASHKTAGYSLMRQPVNANPACVSQGARGDLARRRIRIRRRYKFESFTTRVFKGVRPTHTEIETEYAYLLCRPIVFCEDILLCEFQYASTFSPVISACLAGGRSEMSCIRQYCRHHDVEGGCWWVLSVSRDG
jgi:hypothetical protein